MNDKILIGKVLKPQGILGELKIKDESDGFEAICDLKNVEIDGKEFKVMNVRSSNGFVFLSLSGIYDRTSAEALRGADIYADKSEINKSDDEYFIVDVLGSTLFLSSGKSLGEIVDVIQNRVDIYYVKTNEGTAIFPMLKKLNPVFDLENKRVTVDAKTFTEVVMYEN